MLDLLIRGGTIVDGTGKPARKGDVGVSGGRITVISERIEQEASRTIEASGLHVAPGFIDPHTHSDLTLLTDPKGESKIRQGVTTEVVANCGSSVAPLRGAAVEETRAEAESYGVKLTWASMGEYIERLGKPGTALNVIVLVGHNTVRGSVLGYDDVQPTTEQQAEMERLVAEAMEQGARGLSTGLFYPPGFYARTEEVIRLARVAARRGGIYASHIRSESDGLMASVAEAIEIGKGSGARVEVSHIKMEGHHNWSGVDNLVALLESAADRGVILGCDQYPYAACQTWLAAILPYWAQQGGSKAVAQRMTDPAVRAEMHRDWAANLAEWQDRGGVAALSDILVVDYRPRRDYQGLNIEEIAAAEGKDPLDALMDLIAASEGDVACVWFDQLEEIVQTLMRLPMVVIGSDGRAVSPEGILGVRKTHPRSYGTFPRVLGRYVREQKVLSLEQAVKKMTSMTAERFGLADRGVIRENAWADLTLFDADTVADRATFADPAQYPAGIPYVIVNGTVVIDGGRHSGILAGRVL